MPDKALRPERVCVVGGGVIGAFISYRLAREGVAVSLLERDRLGAGASGVSAGNVQTLAKGFSGFQRDLGRESLALYRELLPSFKEESDIDPLDQEVSYLYAAMDEENAIAYRDELPQLDSGGCTWSGLTATRPGSSTQGSLPTSSGEYSIRSVCRWTRPGL